MTTHDPLLQRISAITTSHLQANDQPVLVALSGGADSVCLLLALQQLGYQLIALHCNFHLRGQESDADEAFVRRLCKQHEVQLLVKHFSTERHARKHKLSIEMAARELRYQWFNEVLKETEAQAIAVAHHRNDQVETMLLNLVRGTGLHGLTGMSVMSAQRILRPLLTTDRSQIEEWLRARGQEWVTDSTNLDAQAAQRNKLRLEVIPMLQELNPAVVDTLCDTAHRLAEAEKVYRRGLEAELAEVCQTDKEGTMHIDIAVLEGSSSVETLLYELMYPRGFTTAQVHEVATNLHGETGTVWTCQEWRLLRDRGCLLLRRSTAEAAIATPQMLPLEGIVTLPHSPQLRISRRCITPGFDIPRSRNCVCLDIDKLALPLSVRSVQHGDRIVPFGKHTPRLVSDILTDQKLSLFQREAQLAVLSGNTIVWLVGIRAAAGYEVDSTTRNVIIIEIA